MYPIYDKNLDSVIKVSFKQGIVQTICRSGASEKIGEGLKIENPRGISLQEGNKKCLGCAKKDLCCQKIETLNLASFVWKQRVGWAERGRSSPNFDENVSWG